MNISLITSVPLAPPWDQGDKNLAYSLARTLSHHRFQVLAARGEPTPDGENLTPVPLFKNLRPTLSDKARIYWWFLRQNNGCPPDLYHFVYRPYPLSSQLARLVPQFRRLPTLHTVPATTEDNPLAHHLFFADHIVALSRYGLDQMQQMGLDNGTYIPTAIHVERWAALSRRSDALKADLGLAGHPVILYPGHYGAGYGADVLVRAIMEIADAMPRVRLIFACRSRSHDDAEREQALRQTLQEAGLGHIARYYHTVEDMRPLIGAADLTVLPLETMRDKVDIPTTLLESLAAAKPVVISDLAPMNELFGDDERRFGRLTAPGDVNALAAAIARLLEDDNRRKIIGQQAQAAMFEQYDIRAVARQYDQLYRKMTS
ncbi:MAG TPA: glycosyltransferase [Candidatus Sulfomarinibacteraceae bacterium]|nr:glycosyltransferase [Candidatus Sulfomarinibacteraceae bacterium]